MLYVVSKILVPLLDRLLTVKIRSDEPAHVGNTMFFYFKFFSDLSRTVEDGYSHKLTKLYVLGVIKFPKSIVFYLENVPIPKDYNMNNSCS